MSQAPASGNLTCSYFLQGTGLCLSLTSPVGMFLSRYDPITIETLGINAGTRQVPSPYQLLYVTEARWRFALIAPPFWPIIPPQ